MSQNGTPSSAGIDIGSRAVKVLLLQGEEVLSRATALAGFDAKAVAASLLAQASSVAGLAREMLARVVATGVGRELAAGRDRGVTEVTCTARGATHLMPDVRTIVEIGAEETRAVRCDATGRVTDFASNEKCAAGTGAFAETLARALDVPLQELGPLSLRSKRVIELDARCVVFVESEMVSLIHQNVAAEDLCRAVHEAMATRIALTVRRVGIERPVAVVGGGARNVGLVESLRRALDLDELRVPESPEFCSALGAALTGVRDARGR